MSQVTRPRSSVVSLLGLRAREYADRPAFIFLNDGEVESARLSFEEVERAAKAAASNIRRLAARGDRVLLCMDSSPEFIAAFFGCLLAGTVPVPAYTPEAARLERMASLVEGVVSDAQPALVVTTTRHRATVQRLVRPAPHTRVLELDRELDAGATFDGPVPEVEPDAVALIMYTSGSTGRPRGVMVSHGNLLHNLSTFSGFTQRRCRGLVTWLPFFHDLGLLFGILHPLYRAVPAVIMPPSAFLERPARWLEAVSRYQASATAAPDFAYRLCVDRITPEARERLNLRSCNLALNGGEPVRADTIERFTELFAPCGFRAEAFYPSYGLTNGTATVSGPRGVTRPRVRTVARHQLETGHVCLPESGEGKSRLVACGRTIRDQRIVIVDPASRRAVPNGTIGEIWVTGPSVALGYWNNPAGTEEVFKARLVGDDKATYLRTGDLGALVSGELLITGRLTDVIIVHGVKHYPQDIEQTVAQCSPAVRSGCVAAFQVDAQGEERLVIVAEARLSGTTAEAVIARTRESVSRDHGLDVAAVVLLPPGAIPKTSSGKIRRQPCRTEFLEGRLTATAEWSSRILRPETAEPPEAPRDAPPQPSADERAEAILRHLVLRFSHRLSVPPAEIDPQQSCARYGLTSIEAAALATELGPLAGRRLSPTMFWEHASLTALAHALVEDTVDPADGGSRISRAQRTPRPDDVAIVGMAVRFPGAATLPELWRMLREGRHSIRTIPPDRWNADELFDPDPSVAGRMTTRWGGFLDGLDRFDAAFFNITPREAMHLDPRQRLMLELAWEALEDAGVPAGDLAGSRTGVFVATLTDDYDDLAHGGDLTRIDAYSGTGSTAHSIVANRLSYFLDLRGPSLTVDTACSGSLVAVHLACQSLRNDDCSLALVGGVNVILRPDGNIFFSKIGALSPEGRCRPFDDRAAGIVRSEGAGLVVLKPLADAMEAGDRIYAVIHGSAVNQDGRTSGLMAPSRRAQEEVLREAYRRARIAPADVQFVEAHGTGTRLGDPIEAEALGAVLAVDRPAGSTCVIGSVKSNVGHLESAAGIAGLIKTALALHYRELPPTADFAQPNRFIPFDELPLTVTTAMTPWPRERDRLLAGVSAFGFGGTNVHVVLGEHEGGRDSVPPEPGPHLLVLSARTPEALRQRADQFHDLLARVDDHDVYDLCYTAAVRREHLAHRMVVLGDTRAELQTALDAGRRGASSPACLRGSVSPEPPRLVFVFPGQGSQWARMGMRLRDQEPVFAAALADCDRELRAVAGWSLLEQLAHAGPGSPLETDTEVAQPAICAIQIALTALWSAWRVTPDAIVGQSLGEIAASQAAGALSRGDALKIAVLRSRLMKGAAGTGRTMVVRLGANDAADAIAPLGGRVTIAGRNGPTSTLVSGDTAAVEELADSLGRRGIRCRTVANVDVPLHSPQLAHAGGELRRLLHDLPAGRPVIRLASSLRGDWIGDTALDATYWADNLTHPTNFADAVRRVIESEHSVFLEIGPRPLLAGSIAETAAALERTVAVLPSMRDDEPEPTTCLRALGALYCRGARIAWRHVYRTGRPCSTPGYPWQRERHWYDQLHQATGPRRADTAGPPKPHPLLGLSAPRVVNGEHVWEWRMGDAPSLSYLQDHQVGGRVVVPGAVWLETALAGVRVAFPRTTCGLRDVSFEQPMFLDAGAAPLVRLRVIGRADRPQRFELSSRNDTIPGGDDWVAHAAGQIERRAETADPVVDLDAIRAACSESISVDRHYGGLRAVGVDLGTRFRPLTGLWRRPGVVLADLRVPDGARSDTHQHDLHPVLIDGAMQAAGATWDAEARTFLPVSVDAVRVTGRGQAALVCRCRLRDGSIQDRERVVDVELVDSRGAIVAELLGVRLQPIDAAHTPREPESTEYAYTLAWQEVSSRPIPTPSARSNGNGNGDGNAVERSRWIVLADRHGVGAALAARLQAAGAHVALLPRAPTPGEFERALASSIRAETAAPAVIDLRALDLEPASADADALVGSAREGVMGAARLLQTLVDVDWRHMVRAFATRARDERTQVLVVTRDAQSATIRHARLSLGQAAVWGLVRAFRWEHPQIHAALVDLDSRDDVDTQAARLAGLLTRDDLPEVACRDGRLYAPTLRPDTASPARTGHLALDRDACYVVAGTGGDVQQAACWMLARGAGEVVVLTPDTETAAQATANRRNDERLTAVVVDIAEAAAIHAFFADRASRRKPPVRGVVHLLPAAGDRSILELDEQSIGTAIGQAVKACWVLQDQFTDAPLEFFMQGASAVSLVGGLAQAHAAAAVAVAEAITLDYRATGLPHLLLNRISLRPAGAGLGPDGLDWAVRANVPQMVVSDAPLSRLFADGIEPSTIPLLSGIGDDRAAVAIGGGTAPRRPAPAGHGVAAGAGTLESRLHELIAEVLGVRPSELDPQTDLSALGLDSMMRTEIRERIAEAFDVMVPAASVFSGASIAALAALIGGASA